MVNLFTKLLDIQQQFVICLLSQKAVALRKPLPLSGTRLVTRTLENQEK